MIADFFPSSPPSPPPVLPLLWGSSGCPPPPAKVPSRNALITLLGLELNNSAPNIRLPCIASRRLFIPCSPKQQRPIVSLCPTACASASTAEGISSSIAITN